MNATQFLNNAIQKYNEKKYVEAISDTDSALQLEESALAYRTRGLCKNDSGNFAEAILDFDKAITLDPQNFPLYMFRGDAKRSLKQFDGAINDYSEALNINHNCITALFNRAVARNSVGKVAEAIEDFEQVSKLQPENADVLYNMALLKRSLKRYEEALLDFERALHKGPNKEIETEMENTKQYIKKQVNIGRFNTLIQEGVANLNSRKLNEAIANFTEIIDQVDNANGQAHRLRGLAYHHLGKQQEAIDDLSRAIQLDHTDSLAFGWRGEVLNALGKTREAIVDYDEAIKLNPKDWKLFLNRAVSNVSVQQYSEALEDCNAAIKLEPGNPTLWYTRAVVQKYLTNYIAAMDDFTEAIKLRPDYQEAKIGLDNVLNLKSLQQAKQSNPVKEVPIEAATTATSVAPQIVTSAVQLQVEKTVKPKSQFKASSMTFPPTFTKYLPRPLSRAPVIDWGKEDVAAWVFSLLGESIVTDEVISRFLANHVDGDALLMSMDIPYLEKMCQGKMTALLKIKSALRTLKLSNQ